MHPMLNVAVRAARKAAQHITQSFDRLDLVKVEVKSQNDYVTQTDIAVERILIENILQNFPNHSILAEESGEIQGSVSAEEGEYQWVIDPLDGTTNFIFGIPHFAISIAIKRNDQIEHAVILDPIKQEEFTASRGHGAHLNGKRIRVTSNRQLQGTLLATGFPFRENQMKHLDGYLATLKDFITQAAGIRRQGSAALDLAYVAAGRYDGYWEAGLQPWDIAAGALLIKEAGGIVSDFKGEEGFLHSGNIVCGNMRIHGAMLQSIRLHTQTPSTLTALEKADSSEISADTEKNAKKKLPITNTYQRQNNGPDSHQSDYHAKRQATKLKIQKGREGFFKDENARRAEIVTIKKSHSFATERNHSSLSPQTNNGDQKERNQPMPDEQNGSGNTED